MKTVPSFLSKAAAIALEFRIEAEGTNIASVYVEKAVQVIAFVLGDDGIPTLKHPIVFLPILVVVDNLNLGTSLYPRPHSADRQAAFPRFHRVLCQGGDHRIDEHADPVFKSADDQAHGAVDLGCRQAGAVRIEHCLVHFTNEMLNFWVGDSIVVVLTQGVRLGGARTLKFMFEPFSTAINDTSRLVCLRIIMIWLGIGFWTVTTIVFIGAVFPLLINTYAGVRNADRLLINVVRSFGASEWEINKLVVLPNSVPFIIAGMRLAIGRAVLGIVVAEFFGGSSAGVGVIMVDAAGKFQVDIVFAGLIIFMTLSLIMTGIVKAIEHKFSRWRPEIVKTF